jgi:hypothetical protein
MRQFESLTSLSDLQNRLKQTVGSAAATGNTANAQGIDNITIRTLLVAKMDGVTL